MRVDGVAQCLSGLGSSFYSCGPAGGRDDGNVRLLVDSEGAECPEAMFSSQKFSKFPVTSNLAAHAWCIKYI